jgi:polyphenol oxidase
VIRKEKDGCVWFEFELLQSYPQVRHGCFARVGGVSTSPYHSLNVGFLADEKRDVVLENRRRVQASIFGTFNGMTYDVEQVHGLDVVLADTKNISILLRESVCIPPLSQPLRQNYGSKVRADALITDTRGVNLLIKHADCQACLLFDPEHQAIGNVHVGWRGNVRGMYSTVMRKMREQWGTKPEKLLACISPSLGPERAEFKNWREELPSSFLEHQIGENYFDFWSISEAQLCAEGLLKSNIEVARMCTFSLHELFFSHRRDKVTGRNATCIALV